MLRIEIFNGLTDGIILDLNFVNNIIFVICSYVLQEPGLVFDIFRWVGEEEKAHFIL